MRSAITHNYFEGKESDRLSQNESTMSLDNELNQNESDRSAHLGRAEPTDNLRHDYEKACRYIEVLSKSIEEKELRATEYQYMIERQSREIDRLNKLLNKRGDPINECPIVQHVKDDTPDISKDTKMHDTLEYMKAEIETEDKRY